MIDDRFLFSLTSTHQYQTTFWTHVLEIWPHSYSHRNRIRSILCLISMYIYSIIEIRLMFLRDRFNRTSIQRRFAFKNNFTKSLFEIKFLSLALTSELTQFFLLGRRTFRAVRWEFLYKWYPIRSSHFISLS